MEAHEIAKIKLGPYFIAFIVGVVLGMYAVIKIDQRRAHERAIANDEKISHSIELQKEANQKILIDAGFAEYDRKTGKWQLLTKEQVCAEDRKEQEAQSTVLLPYIDLGTPTTTKSKKSK